MYIWNNWTEKNVYVNTIELQNICQLDIATVRLKRIHKRIEHEQLQFIHVRNEGATRNVTAK